MQEVRVVLPRRLRGVVPGDPNAVPTPSAAVPLAPPPAPPSQDMHDRQALQRLLAGLAGAAAGLQKERQQEVDELRRAAVELAVAVASQILQERIDADEYAVEARVRQVVERLELGQPVTVYLHPEDLALLKKHVDKGRAPFPEGADVRLAADPSLDRGDCRAETAEAGVLARLEEQLGDVRRHLLHSLPDPALRPFPARRQTA